MMVGRIISILRKKRKAESHAANPSNKLAGKNLSLSKIFKSAPATQVMLSDQEANRIVDNVINGKFAEGDELQE